MDGRNEGRERGNCGDRKEGKGGMEEIPGNDKYGVRGWEKRGEGSEGRVRDGGGRRGENKRGKDNQEGK